MGYTSAKTQLSLQSLYDADVTQLNTGMFQVSDLLLDSSY